MKPFAWLLLPVAVVSTWTGLFAQCPDGSTPPCHGATRPAAPASNSVAVLYFDNLSRDTADAYLADGLTEDIIVRLGQIERLAVKSRNAVKRFRERAAEDPAVLGRSLGVAYLVSGSVRRAGARLRVTVQLVRAARGLAIADRMLRSDSTAADAWLARGNLLRSVDLQRAREALRLATVFDPQNAEAFTFYGVTLRDLGDDAAASRALLHALELDPASPITMAILADGAFIERRYQEASRWTDSALTIDPGFHDGYAFRGLFRLYLGYMSGARVDSETSLRLG